MKDGAPEWYRQLLARQRAEEEDEHWNAYLAEEWRPAAGFISMSESAGFEDDVRTALRAAYVANEPWLLSEKPPGMDELGEKMRAAAGPAYDTAGPEHPIRGYCFWIKLKPRDAVLWLLSKPPYKHLVPAGLARVVLGDANIQPDVTVTAAPTAMPERRRGPKPRISNRVLLAMRLMPFDKLKAMDEEDMQATFGASRNTCRKARNTRESELRTPAGNSAKI